MQDTTKEIRDKVAFLLRKNPLLYFYAAEDFSRYVLLRSLFSCFTLIDQSIEGQKIKPA